MSTLSRTLWGLASLFAFLILPALGGCASSQTTPYQVTVSLDERLRDSSGNMPSLEVDLIGVADPDLARWRSYPLDAYFAGGDAFRADADKRTLEFADADPRALARDDEAWKRWKKSKATHLVVLANIPGVFDRAGTDGRRLILPLDPERWSTRSIEIQVQRTGLVPTTPLLPEN